jgi:hypothetical protein
MDRVKKILSITLVFLMMTGEAWAWGPGHPPSLESAQTGLFMTLNLMALMIFLCLLFILAWTGFCAFSLMGRLLWPARLQIIEETIEKNMGKSLLLGIVNILGALIIIILLRGTGLLPLFLIIFLLFTTYFSLMGLPALLTILGNRLLRTASLPSSPVYSIIAGSVLLMGLSLIPFLGFLMAKILGITAFGGSLLTVFSYKKQTISAMNPTAGGPPAS